MFPKPHMSDVFMDLMADSAEFLTGKAHRGMALGSNNIYERCQEVLLKGSIHISMQMVNCHIYITCTHGQYILYYAAISDFPNYGILITGYSLGAGVCQLLTMDIMNRQNEGGEIPPEVPIRGLSFGSPPVYECPENRTHPNIFSVVNNHDGLGT